MSLTQAAPDARTALTLQRNHLFASLMVAAVANSFVHAVTRAFAEQGAAGALANGLGMSWAFWIAWALAARLALKAPGEPASRADLIVAAGCLVLVLAPVQALAGVASTVLGGWFLVTGRSPQLRSAALVLLAIAFSVFWAQIVGVLFSRPVAMFDAFWVNLMSGTEIDGTYVKFAETPGGFALFPGCTSVSNASLAILLWIAVVRTFRPEGLRREWLWALGVFASVVLINGARLALMAQNRPAFDYWHTGPGAGIVIAVITLTGLAWAVAGVRRELFR